MCPVAQRYPYQKVATSSTITLHDEIFMYPTFPLICFILHFVHVFRMKEGPFFPLT